MANLDTGDFRTIRDLSTAELRRLNNRELTIITLAFGLDGSKPQSYPRIARALGGGISPERVRQLRNVAIGKLQKARDPRWPRASR